MAPGHSLSGSISSRLKTDASLKAPSVSGDGGSSLPVLSTPVSETSAIGMNMFNN